MSVRIYSKYVATFEDDTFLTSFEMTDIPEGTVRHININYKNYLYYCTSSSKISKFNNTYGFKGKYVVHWRVVKNLELLIDKNALNTNVGL